VITVSTRPVTVIVADALTVPLAQAAPRPEGMPVTGRSWCRGSAGRPVPAGKYLPPGSAEMPWPPQDPGRGG
jgi:hypothetical protein